jgi:uncharacterized membrane protein
MAHSDLIIMAFGHKEGALLTRRALEIMRDRQLFGLEHVTEITCDAAGRTALHHHWSLPVHPHRELSHLTVMLSSAIFDHHAENRHRTLADARLDEFFLQEVMRALAPNTSALLIYVPSNTTTNIRALLNTLSLFEGIVHRTTLSSEAERILINWDQTDRGLAP